MSIELEKLETVIQQADNVLTTLVLMALKQMCVEAGKDGLDYDDARKWVIEICSQFEFDDWWNLLCEEMPSDEDGNKCWSHDFKGGPS